MLDGVALDRLRHRQRANGFQPSFKFIGSFIRKLGDFSGQKSHPFLMSQKFKMQAANIPMVRIVLSLLGAKVGTRYFKSTDGTFAVTWLKKNRRYFIRYIFEKVPTVPVLGSVIRDFLKEKFCTFWKQYFR